MFFTADLVTKAEEVICALKEQQLRLCLAESCTGGLFAALITEIPGASKILDRGLVTYSEAAKMSLLGVKAQTIAKQGVVSVEVAEEMARGCGQDKDTVFLAVTGYAGSYFESNAENNDPNHGLVYISSFNSRTKKMISRKFNFAGDRFAVRKSSLVQGMNLLLLNVK